MSSNLINLGIDPDRETFEDLLEKYHGVASDVFLQSGTPVKGRIQGLIRDLSSSVLSHSALSGLVEEMIGSEACSAVRMRIPKSMAYSINFKDHRNSLRFRTQSRMCMTDRENRALQMVLRPIPFLPPLLDHLSLPEGLLSRLFPADGCVLVTGPTGAGKTTLLASIMRYILTELDPYSLMTVEDPVEFNLFNIKAEDRLGFLSHSEKDFHFETFESVLKSVLRENPDRLMIGEMRDYTTIRLAAAIALTGHAVYATAHTNNTADIPVRLAQQVPNEIRSSFVDEFLGLARTYVHQRLIICKDEKRRPIIEWVSFEPDDRRELQDRFIVKGFGEVGLYISRLTEDSGLSLTHSADRLYQDGHIDGERFDGLCQEFGWKRRSAA